jgi:hypothetical protein
VTIDAEALKKFGLIAVELRPVSITCSLGGVRMKMMEVGTDSTGVTHEIGNK